MRPRVSHPILVVLHGYLGQHFSIYPIRLQISVRTHCEKTRCSPTLAVEGMPLISVSPTQTSRLNVAHLLYAYRQNGIVSPRPHSKTSVSKSVQTGRANIAH